MYKWKIDFIYPYTVFDRNHLNETAKLCLKTDYERQDKMWLLSECHIFSVLSLFLSLQRETFKLFSFANLFHG